MTMMKYNIIGNATMNDGKINYYYLKKKAIIVVVELLTQGTNYSCAPVRGKIFHREGVSACTDHGQAWLDACETFGANIDSWFPIVDGWLALIGCYCS